MRRVLTGFVVVSAMAGLGWSQALTEAAGMIAGGSIGSVAGKKVSDGINNVLQKVDATAKTAAKTGQTPQIALEKAKDGAVLQVSPGGVVKDHSLVPPPPPPVRRAAAVPPPPPPLPQPPTIVLRQSFPVLPPPRQVTVDDLKMLASGTGRVEVLKLGAPASRITMYDDGHLVEIYRYQLRDTTLGVVRLSDGSVSSVQLP